MSLSPEQQKIVDLVIERAEQACRYAFKHQNFEGTHTTDNYREGWEIGASVCEGAIKPHVLRHIETDLKEEGVTGG